MLKVFSNLNDFGGFVVDSFLCYTQKDVNNGEQQEFGWPCPSYKHTSPRFCRAPPTTEKNMVWVSGAVNNFQQCVCEAVISDSLIYCKWAITKVESGFIAEAAPRLPLKADSASWLFSNFIIKLKRFCGSTVSLKWMQGRKCGRALYQQSISLNFAWVKQE